MFSYRGNRIAIEAGEKSEKRTRMSSTFEEVLTSTRERKMRRRTGRAARHVAVLLATTSRMFSSFQGKTIYRPSGIRDHKSVRVRSAMIYSSHGRSTLRYIVVDGRIVTIECFSKWGHVELCSSQRRRSRRVVISSSF